MSDNMLNVDEQSTDEHLNVKFTREVHNLYTLAGDLHSSTEEDFITITCPGDATNVIHELVDDSHKRRFRRQWEAYSNNQEMQGSPIEEWPAMSQAQMAQFKLLGFNFVEQVANAPHSAFDKIMGGASWKNRASEYLSSLKADESITIKKQQQEIDELKAMVAELAKKKAS